MRFLGLGWGLEGFKRFFQEKQKTKKPPTKPTRLHFSDPPSISDNGSPPPPLTVTTSFQNPIPHQDSFFFPIVHHDSGLFAGAEPRRIAGISPLPVLAAIAADQSRSLVHRA